MKIFGLATLWALVGFVIVVFVGGHAPASKEVLVFVPMLWLGSLLSLWVANSNDREIRRRWEVIEKRRQENGR